MVIHATDQAGERERIKTAAEFVLGKTNSPPRVAMLLGTGHTSFAGRLKDRVAVVTNDIPEYPHRHGTEVGTFLLGHLAGVNILVADAPLSAHEGFTPREIAFPVRMLKAMGVDFLVLTAGAASLNPIFDPGDLALVEDHLNLANLSPLHGPPEDNLGPRFPDMTEPYSAPWRRKAREVAREANFPCHEGVLAYVCGPSLPTRAEYRFLRNAGADLVGMSTVPEVLAAVYVGMKVLAVLGVTQRIDFNAPRPASVEEMLDASDLAAPRMATLLTGLIEGMAPP
jgi:purine-nucleoside phosphorylase